MYLSKTFLLSVILIVPLALLLIFKGHKDLVETNPKKEKSYKTDIKNNIFNVNQNRIVNINQMTKNKLYRRLETLYTTFDYLHYEELILELQEEILRSDEVLNEIRDLAIDPKVDTDIKIFLIGLLGIFYDKPDREDIFEKLILCDDRIITYTATISLFFLGFREQNKENWQTFWRIWFRGFEDLFPEHHRFQDLIKSLKQVYPRPTDQIFGSAIDFHSPLRRGFKISSFSIQKAILRKIRDRYHNRSNIPDETDYRIWQFSNIAWAIQCMECNPELIRDLEDLMSIKSEILKMYIVFYLTQHNESFSKAVEMFMSTDDYDIMRHFMYALRKDDYDKIEYLLYQKYLQTDDEDAKNVLIKGLVRCKNNVSYLANIINTPSATDLKKQIIISIFSDLDDIGLTKDSEYPNQLLRYMLELNNKDISYQIFDILRNYKYGFNRKSVIEKLHDLIEWHARYSKYLEVRLLASGLLAELQ